MRRRVWMVVLVTLGVIASGLAAGAPAGAELTTAVYRTDGVEGELPATTNIIPSHVFDMQTIGNTVYVAGRFARVVSTTGAWPRTDQPYLAAFDATTGRWIDWWRPALNRPAWALDVTADGSLLVGGEFTTVNGAERSAMVALDPRTGQTDPRFTAQLTRPNTTAAPVVRDFYRDGARMYVAGNFSRVVWGNPANPTRTPVTKVARVDATTGAADPTWQPSVSGRSVWSVVTSGNGTRVHLGGEFSYVNSAAGSSQLATVDAVTGANVAGWDNGPNQRLFAQWPVGGIVYDLGVYDNNLFVAGAEHFWEVRRADNGAQVRMVSSPHDTQRIEVFGDRVYIGCHCFRSSRALQAIEVSGVTGQRLRTLGDSLTGGEGAWGFALTPDRCLWVGGDFRSTTQLVGAAAGSTQWVGRFARLCDTAGPFPHDVPSLTRPPAPPDPNVVVAAGSSWRYLADGTHPAGWTTTAFNDGAWSTGAAELGYGDGDEATVIPRQGLSAVFRRDFDADPSASPYLDLALNVDDGATVWINGRPVVAENMPTGEISATTLSSTAVFGPAESDVTSYRLPSSVLVAGTNTIAVSVHQSDSGSNDLTFDLSLRRVDDAGGGVVSTPDITVPAPPPPPPADPVDLIASGATWRYLDDGSDQGTGWRSRTFDDAAWAQGPAKLGFGMGDEVTVTRAGGRPVTAYFRHRFSLPDASAYGTLTIRLLRDDGAVVYLNGTELVRYNLPAGAVGHLTNAVAFVTGAAQSRWYEFTVPASALRSGENVLAVEVHQALDSQDLAFDLGLRAQ